jgi:competence protein ComEC
MNQGDKCGSRHLTFTCVYPFDGTFSDDINALSLALLMEYDKDCDGTVDYSGFFGGDLGAEQEIAIAQSGNVGHVDLLKVSHHGSETSSSPHFISHIRPRLGVISCGKHNRYGHPAQDTLERLAARHIIPLRTDQLGAIKVVFCKEKLRWYSYRYQENQF